MRYLTDEALIDAYVMAKNLQLDYDFIVLLEQEIQRRGLQDQLNISKESR